MKKKMKGLLCLWLAIIMVVGLLPMTAGAAGSGTAPETIKIGGITLTDGKYLASNDATSASTYTAGDSYVALYKDGVLYLNGLNITKDSACVWWEYSNNGKHDLVIELAEGSVNTLVCTSGSSIKGETGSSTSGGPCLTIRGNGTLNTTGSSYGIWVWEDITVENGVTLNVTGVNNSGIANNCAAGDIVIKQGADVVTTGKTYGVECDHGRAGSLLVLGGSFTAMGDTSALKVIADFSGNTVYVGSSASDAAVWNGTTALNSYKYISLSGFSSAVTTYNVDKATTENGSFEVDYTKSMADETVTINASPEIGYEVDAVTVTDADSGNVTVSGSGNTYSFTMPAKNVTVSVSFKATSASTPVSLMNNGYPYGKAMSTNSVTLVMDVAGADDTTGYQWQSCATKDGTYVDISGETGKTMTLSSPTSGTWYRCVVNGTLTSKVIQVVKPGQDGYTWTASYSSYYYVTNGTVAYTINSDCNRFDVTGFYVKGTTNYMLQTSYSHDWQMFSSTSAVPSPHGSSTDPNAQLDALRVSFDEADSCAVYFEADLKDSQQAFSFGCDTQLGNSSTSGNYADSAALIGTVENDSLKQVAMIGAASEAAAKESDPAFVIAPDPETPASKFWIGGYSSRQYYGSSTGTKIEGGDSGMTMSWLNVPSGGSVKFVFKVGTAEATGAISSGGISSSTDSVTLNLPKAATDIVVKVNGNTLDSNKYTVNTDNPLAPVITFLPEAGLTHESVITVDVTLTGETTPQNLPITNNIPVPTYTVKFYSNGGIGTIADQTFTGGVSQALSANTFTYEGHTFKGWCDADSGSDAIVYTDAQVISTDKNLNLKAVWEKNTYSVSFDANGGTGTMEAQTFTYGEAQKLKPNKFTNDGYVFRGWEYNGSTYTDEAEITVTGNITLKAIWDILVSFDVQGHGTAPDAQVVAAGDKVVAPEDPSAVFYIFQGWYADADCTVEWDFDNGTVTAPMTLYAKWRYAPPIHFCQSKCPVCGGCKDADCVSSACKTKCNLVNFSYSDVPADAWYEEAVYYCYHHGLMDGVGGGKFAPMDATSRAMIVTLLWRVEGKPEVDFEMSFEDVAADMWYTEAVRWAASEGIVTGFSAEVFAPDKDISREQFAAILWRYAKYKGYDVSSGEETNILSYEDALRISGYAIEAMQWACAEDVISGRDDGTLDPHGLAKRCEAAVMTMRFCEAMK